MRIVKKTNKLKIVARAPFFLKLKKQKVNEDIKKIVDDFDTQTKEKKDFLTNVYLKSYEYGTKVVKKESFSDGKNIVCQELKERFDNYSDVGTKDLAFLKKVAEEDEAALDEILKESAAQDDFIYITYESNYIDRSMDIMHSLKVPSGFESIDVTLLSQDAFADGAMKKIDYYSKEMLSAWAANLIGEMS
jgi:hypothetical protein